MEILSLVLITICLDLNSRFDMISLYIGMDAQVSYAFHSERKLHPEKFKNQLANQVLPTHLRVVRDESLMDGFEWENIAHHICFIFENSSNIDFFFFNCKNRGLMQRLGVPKAGFVLPFSIPLPGECRHQTRDHRAFFLFFVIFGSMLQWGVFRHISAVGIQVSEVNLLLKMNIICNRLLTRTTWYHGYFLSSVKNCKLNRCSISHWCLNYGMWFIVQNQFKPQSWILR